MQQFNTVGVYMYLDAGHAGWLGWPANLSPAAQFFAQLYKAAGSPLFVRGLATNVANYNALSSLAVLLESKFIDPLCPLGATTPDPVTQGNPNYDELLFINVRCYRSVAAFFSLTVAVTGPSATPLYWWFPCSLHR
jgi:cellulose 1,4-beta-cellobiosidase